MRLLSTFRRHRKPASPRKNRARLRVEQLETRVVPYTTSGNAWPHPNLVTLSLVPDGTNLGGVTSNLLSTFDAKWSRTTWENQVLLAAQVWAQQTGLNFTVINDNGGAIGSGSYQQGDPNMGDIRLGGYNFNSSTLASAYLPPPVNNYSIAGDIQFNTGTTFNIGTTYDLFTVAAHEIGHALGLLHSTNSAAIMYATYTTKKSALNSDDISGIQAIYGGVPVDSVSNSTFATATNLNSQITSANLTALVTGLDLTTTSDVDYYTFTAPSGTNSSFTVTVQSNGLSLLGPSVTVYASDQVTVLAGGSGKTRTGNTLTYTITGVSAGQQFYVKVAGADTTAFATGAYALVLNFGSGSAPTVTGPNTQVLNGNPLTSGGGVPDSPPDPNQDTPGRDIFDIPAVETRQSVSGNAHGPSAAATPMPSGIAVLGAEGGTVPTLTLPTFVASPTLVAPRSNPAAAAISALANNLSGGAESKTEESWDSAEWEEIVRALVPSIPASMSEAAPAQTTPATERADSQINFGAILSAPASEAYFAAPLSAGPSAAEPSVAEDGTAATENAPMLQMVAAVAAVGLWSQRLESDATRRRFASRA
jgi:hypothetical protein